MSQQAWSISLLLGFWSQQSPYEHSAIPSNSSYSFPSTALPNLPSVPSPLSSSILSHPPLKNLAPYWEIQRPSVELFTCHPKISTLNHPFPSLCQEKHVLPTATLNPTSIYMCSINSPLSQPTAFSLNLQKCSNPVHSGNGGKWGKNTETSESLRN